MLVGTLTGLEYRMAAFHAIERRAQALERHRATKSHTEFQLDYEVHAACAELAWCKLKGIYWTGGAGLGEPDAGKADIRWTRHPAGGLIGYENDPEDRPYILATGADMEYQFVGWAWGKTIREKGAKMSYGWLLDRALLKPMPSK